MKRLLLFLLLPVQLFAQDISGNWKGFIEMDEGEFPFEIIIHNTAGDPEGYCMITLTIDGEENIGIKTVKLKQKKKGLYLEDDELVFSDFKKPGKRVILSAMLSYNSESNATEMSGTYRTRSLDFRDQRYYTGNIFLKKMKDPGLSKMNPKLAEMRLLPWPDNTLASSVSPAKTDVTKAVKKEKAKEETMETAKAEKPKKTDLIKEKKETTAAVTIKKESEPLAIQAPNKNTAIEDKKTPPPPTPLSAAAALAERKIEVIHTYFSVSDSIELTFYDNGTIDGDTISVLLDGKTIVEKEQLSLNPIKRKIGLPAGKDSMQLIMYAENLGSIPPNTGILIMQDGKTRNEIRFTGDLKINASILLKRRK